MTALSSLDQLFNSSQLLGQAKGVPKKLIWISMRGGWDLLEVTDPKRFSNNKLDVGYDYSLAHSLAGSNGQIKIGRWLPRLASLGKYIVVVRGLAMGTVSHDVGPIYMDTGVLSNGGDVNAASIPSIVASESQATIPLIQLNGGANPATDRGLLNPVSVVRAENLPLYRSMYPEDLQELIKKTQILDYLQDSISKLESQVGKSDRIAGISIAEKKIRQQFVNNVGSNLILGDQDRIPFGQNSPSTLTKGQIDPVALALKLIKNNIVTCVNLGFGGFDTHTSQDTRLEPLLTNFDYLLSTLVRELEKSSLLSDTLIVVYSDFGRTPRINTRRGRDHWPVGGAFLIGGGLQGGRAVGGTDDQLLATNVDFDSGLPDSNGNQLSPIHLGGSVLELLLGKSYLNYRNYLQSIPSLIR